jgi:hypothetical protein
VVAPPEAILNGSAAALDPVPEDRHDRGRGGDAMSEPTEPTEPSSPPLPTLPLPPEVDPATRRALAVGLYNRCWELLELTTRTPEQDAELIHMAHASRYHWGEIADTPARLWRGEWMCARVYSVLGRAEPALWHARRAVTLVEAGGDAVEDWDRPAVCEGMARASFVAGDPAAGAIWKARAAELAAALADADGREVIERDLATLPG